MKLRHFLYDLTDVLLLHRILNVPGVVVELLSLTGHWSLAMYLMGGAWALVQLFLGVKYRDALLRWWERLPSAVMWCLCGITISLFLAGLAEEVVMHGWQY